VIQATPDTRRSHRQSDRRRKALALLVSCRDGCPEALVIAHGFTARQLAAASQGLPELGCGTTLMDNTDRPLHSDAA
jgi:hypothetical protein